MTGRALVVGGTGPTGIHVVAGLVARGYDVTILHRGTHEREETPAQVRHVHADPFDPAQLADATAGTFDLVVAMYGRLRHLAAATRGRTGRFVSVGGVPALRGWMNPWLALPLPVGEDHPTVDDPSQDAKGYRVARTEEAVFQSHPQATHLRYPYAYGPYQLAPREWSIVRRILDGRSRIVVPDQGLTLHHHGFTENLAHAVLLAVDSPHAAGRLYHAADTQVLSVAEVITVIADALGASLEQVSLPYDLAVPARPLLAQPLPRHRVLDLTRIRSELGYTDAVAAPDALARTAHWLTAHPPAPGATEEMVLTDPFDYAAEDALMDAWLAAARPDITFATPPGYGLAYSGPGGRPRSQEVFLP